MASTTTNLKLTKPSLDENYDVTVFNDNADKIDTALNQKISKVSGAIADNIAIFTNSGAIVDSGKNMTQMSNEFIKDTLPTASEKYDGIHFLYIGPSENNLVTNTYYKCVHDTTLNTYSWQRVIVGLSYSTVSDTDNIVGI